MSAPLVVLAVLVAGFVGLGAGYVLGYGDGQDEMLEGEEGDE